MARTTKQPAAPPVAPPPEAPEHLSGRAKSLWYGLVPHCRSMGRRALLQAALESLDRADAARVAVGAGGMVSMSASGTPHVSPLLRVERDSRQLFARLMDQLRLTWDNDPDGRT